MTLHNTATVVSRQIILQTTFFLSFLFTLAITLGGQQVQASDNKQHGIISLQTLYDSSNTRDTFLDLSVEAGKRTTLFAGAGNSSGAESSPGAGDELDLDYWNTGISYQFNDSFTLGLGIRNTGQGNDINSRNIDIDLIWSGNDWSFRLSPQFRKLELLFTTRLGASRIIDINSTGIGTSITYRGLEKWEIGGAFNTYDYDRDVRRLALVSVIRLISAKALTVASGLSDYSFNINATRLYAESDITVAYGQNKSAIDGKILNFGSVNMTFYQLDPVSIGIDIGAVGSDVDTAGYYGGLTLGYAW